MNHNEKVVLRVTRVGSVHMELPAYQTDGSAGMDLRAAVEAPVVIEPGRRAMVPTGLAIAIPRGYEGQVRPRSGLAWRYGITVLNTPGTIDSDYRGEVRVVLVNFGEETFEVRPGERIAQLLIAPVAHATVEVQAVLDETERGAGGYGSTGVS